MKHLALAVLAGLVAPFGSLNAQRPQPSPGVRLVQRLYTDFACEAVVEEPECDRQHTLLDQPQAVLARLFDAALTRLWLADRRCEARTHEECRINFLPIWSSQDPSGTFIRILPTSDSTRVDVELRHPYNDPRVLHYTLVWTKTRWRIHDIALDNEWSLVALLSKKP